MYSFYQHLYLNSDYDYICFGVNWIEDEFCTSTSLTVSQISVFIGPKRGEMHP